VHLCRGHIPLQQQITSSCFRTITDYKISIHGNGSRVATFLIIRSPFGRRSGAHFNPALTLTYFWLGRVHRWDALGYIAAHFMGGLVGVFVAHQLFGTSLSDFPVVYVITTPGHYGKLSAFLAELIMSFVLMGVVSC
jgi:aquaporin Z